MGEELTDSQRDSWASLLGVVLWLPGVLDNALKPHSLSHYEFQILWWLSLTETGTCKMGDLADSASVTPSHLSRIATRLETRKWITRHPDPDDARFTVATLTRQGAAKVADCLPDYHATVHHHVFDHLGPTQQRQLGAITTKILNSIHPDC